MKTLLLGLVLIVGFLGAETVEAWQNIRFSGKNAASQVLLRTEINQSGLIQNKVIYDSGTGNTEFNATLYDAATNTYQASIPVGTSRRYLGLKKQMPGAYARTIPVYYDGTALPTLAQLTKASDDALNDNTTNYYDIVADYVSFSDTKFYAGIQNRGGGFPTSTEWGFVYPSYMSVIANPDSDPGDPNLIVWAMAYINVSIAGFTPGLYKISGTSSSDLVRIGNIQTQIISGSNLLVMSCNIADLMADADFAAWYNPDNPVFGLKTIINKTAVLSFETTNQDESPGAKNYPHKLYIDPTPNSAPSMLGGSFQISGDDVFFAASYQDTEGNFPLTAQIEIQDGGSYDLLPQSFDYDVSVPHRTLNLTSALGEYSPALARTVVSDDNINIVRSDWFPFQYILGILLPDEVAVQISGGNVQLSWDPVTLTVLGNPVTPDLYRIEASSTPEFESFETIGTSTVPYFNVVLQPDAPKMFYRVVAIKNQG